MTDNGDTDIDLIRASNQDPHNAILNVEKQADIGLASSGVNPGLTANAVGGWVTIQTQEALSIPGAFSTDPSFTQGNTTGTVGGTGVDPTGAGDIAPTGAHGGYTFHKDDPLLDDPNSDGQLLQTK